MGRRPGSALTREDVLRAALAVVRSGGPLGPASVAAELGIRAPSVYHHFASAEALRHAVAVVGWRQLLAELPLGATLAEWAHAYRAFALGNAALYRLMTETPFDPTDPELLAVTARGLEALARLGLPPDQLLHAIRGLRAAVHGFVDLELRGQVRLDVPAEQSFDWLLGVVVRGLR